MSRSSTEDAEREEREKRGEVARKEEREKEGAREEGRASQEMDVLGSARLREREQERRDGRAGRGRLKWKVRQRKCETVYGKEDERRGRGIEDGYAKRTRANV